MKHRFMFRDQVFELEMFPGGARQVAKFQGQALRFKTLQAEDGVLVIEAGGKRAWLQFAVERDRVWVAFQGRTYVFKKGFPSGRRSQAGESKAEGLLRAPMPGQVRAVAVQAQDPVQKGDTLLVLEAMKMEIRVQAPFDGRVVELPVAAGDQVDKEQLLVEIAPQQPE